MYPRMYIGSLCRELFGISPPLPGCHNRPDPEGFFSGTRHHTTDTRLDPTVRDEIGNQISFSDLLKGDVVKVRVVLETRTPELAGRTKTKVDICARAQAVTIVKRADHLTNNVERMEDVDLPGLEEDMLMEPDTDILM